MLQEIQAEWRVFKYDAPGERFLGAFERHQARETRALKHALFFISVFTFVLGFVLADHIVLSVLCFVISGALFALDSQPLASGLDRVECFLRFGSKAQRARQRTRDAQATTCKERLDPEELERAVRAVTVRKRESQATTRKEQLDPELERAVRAVTVRKPIVRPIRQTVPFEKTAPAPRPRIAGTMKLWAAEPAPAQPVKAPIITPPPRRTTRRNPILVIPPPVQVTSPPNLDVRAEE